MHDHDQEESQRAPGYDPELYDCSVCNDSGINHADDDYCTYCSMGKRIEKLDAWADHLRPHGFTNAMRMVFRSTQKTERAIAAAEKALLLDKIAKLEAKLSTPTAPEGAASELPKLPEPDAYMGSARNPLFCEESLLEYGLACMAIGKACAAQAAMSEESPAWADFDIERTGDDLKDASGFLLTAALEFWESCKRAKQYGAVRWLEGTNGELLIFTRGEYRDRLIANIEAQQPTHYFAPQPSLKKTDMHAALDASKMALTAMLEQFTRTPSTLKDSAARNLGHAALKLIDQAIAMSAAKEPAP